MPIGSSSAMIYMNNPKSLFLVPGRNLISLPEDWWFHIFSSQNVEKMLRIILSSGFAPENGRFYVFFCIISSLVNPHRNFLMFTIFISLTSNSPQPSAGKSKILFLFWSRLKTTTGLFKCLLSSLLHPNFLSENWKFCAFSFKEVGISYWILMPIPLPLARKILPWKIEDFMLFPI